MPTNPLPLLTPKDLTSDQPARWCPGCGDFSVLTQFKAVLAALGLPRERVVLVSGSGCSSRLPYYVNTYGFHTLHGRAPAVATGLKVARPELSVWVLTGDGDGLSIGTSHLVHALRRNVNLKILLFNNETLGLTRGQTSPTARPGTRTSSSPEGSFEPPLRPLSVALAAEATFVARTIDVDAAHLTETLRRAAEHPGAAFVEILQNCIVFNDGVFEYLTDKAVKDDNLLYLEDGQPLVFGKDGTKGLRFNGPDPEVVTLGNGHNLATADLARHDERAAEPNRALALSRLSGPDFPECVGVFRAVERPTFEGELAGRQQAAVKARGAGDLQGLLNGEETWVVE
jgi:2-oxoglutarate ferredoxin oxidoreductase subunit beta